MSHKLWYKTEFSNFCRLSCALCTFMKKNWTFVRFQVYWMRFWRLSRTLFLRRVKRHVFGLWLNFCELSRSLLWDFVDLQLCLILWRIERLLNEVLQPLNKILKIWRVSETLDWTLESFSESFYELCLSLCLWRVCRL